MQTKICTTCKTDKPISEFEKLKRGTFGVSSACKTCRKIYKHQFYLKHRERKIREAIQWRRNHPEYTSQYQKQWRNKNRIRCNTTSRIYHSSPHCRAMQYAYRHNPLKKSILIAGRKRFFEKHRQNPHWRMIKNLRSRCRTILKGKGTSASSMKLLGCDKNTLRQHLESRFQLGMTWENYGEWHIDHIKPISKFDLIQPLAQKQCFHYTNLQPLWAKDNLSKGNRFASGTH